MTGCSVKGCRNRSEYGRSHFTRKNVNYHSFPKDKNVYAKWIKACGAENIKVSTAKVCSDHFLPIAYRKLIRSRRLVPSSQYRRLKEDAIPSEKLPSAETQILLKCPNEGTNSTTKGSRVDEANFSNPINLECIIDLVIENENHSLPVSFPTEKKMEIINFSHPKPVNVNSELARFLLENPVNSTVQRKECNTAKSAGSENIRKWLTSNDADSTTYILDNEDSQSAKNCVQTSRFVQNIHEKDDDSSSNYEEEMRKLKEENNVLKHKLREKDKQFLTSENIKNKYKAMLKSVFTPREINVLLQNIKQGTTKWSAEDTVAVVSLKSIRLIIKKKWNMKIPLHFKEIN